MTPSTSTPVRFALAGFGAWGRHHASSIAGTPGAELVAITAATEASRAEAARQYPQARVFTDALTMIAATACEVVDIVTPSDTHRDLAEAALAAGHFVLLEKPMATTLDDCRAIAAAAARHGDRLAVGHELRLSSQWGEIRRIIEAGTIGRPQYVLVELSRKPYRPGAAGWRYDPARVGSWVLEEPIHFFDLARWYLADVGDPVELVAYANSRDASRPELFDNFSAMMRWPDGAYAVVSQTLAAFEHHQTVKVTGTKGAVWAGWSGAVDRTTEPSFFLKVFDGEVLVDSPITRASGEVFELREEIAACVRCVRDRAAPVASARDGLWSAGLCLLAEESIRSGSPVTITGRLEPHRTS
jgi:myo-inositol 2-dehydrogenase/D-chiro-inositol 1-dehydrogenase